MKAETRAAIQAALNASVQHPTLAAAARALDLPEMTVRNRIKIAKRMGLKPTVARSSSDPALLNAEITQLRADLAAAERKAAQAQITETMVREGIIGLVEAPVQVPSWLLKAGTITAAPGVPTLFCSDWHWDEVVKPSQIGGVNEYNRALAHSRLQALVETAIYLCRIISPKMDYPGMVVPLGGDMISGNIHDELVATNQFNTMPTILDILGKLIWMIDRLLEVFPRLFLPCVSGNHGRDTRKIWVKDRHATSFDWLIYNLLAKHYENDKRVTFLIPDGPDAYYRVYGHRYLLTHGDQFRGGDGLIGVLGPIIRGDHKKRSRNAQIDMAYDTMLLGHFHQYIHHSRVIVNGSLKGYDEYAYSNNFGYEEPQQALWLNHPKHGITYRMPVKVDRTKQEHKTEWVSIKDGA
jgi:hypothetical protein